MFSLVPTRQDSCAVWQLHPSLSFAEIDGRFVFLDLPGDRYFCLEGSAAHAWRCVVEHRASAAQIEAMKRKNLLVEGSSEVIEACGDAVPRESLLDAALPAPGILAGLSHVMSVAKARRRIRKVGIEQAVRSLVEARDSERRGSRPAMNLAEAVGAFTRFDAFVTTLDQCLARSIALAMHLVRQGHKPNLVFAVRLGPFAAHCWVECGGFLVNDRYERVRMFTPVRRL